MRIDRAALSRFAALRLRAGGAATALQAGDRRSPFRGRGLEFADFRPYDPGDDLRLVDWNVYFRLGVALVRQFTEERSLSVRICLDTSESMAFGTPRKADHGAQLAATLAMIGLRHRDPVTLACFGAGTNPVSARAVNLDGLPELLHMLERTEPGGRGDAIAQLITQLGDRRCDRLVVISDLLFDEQTTDAILRRSAAACSRPIVLHVLGEDELAPNLDDIEKVVDAETGDELAVSDGPAAQAAYAAALTRWLSAIEERCRGLGIQYIRADAREAAGSLVQDELYRGQVVEHIAGGAR